MDKKLAFIDNVIVSHKPLFNECLLRKHYILVSVEYSSGKVRHYFPRIDTIPKRVYNFIETSLQYYPDNKTTIFRYGKQQ